MEHTPAPSAPYFFTVTLNPHLWGSMALEGQFLNSRRLTHTYLRKVFKEYRMFPELQKNGNIHYHGIGFDPDKIKWSRQLKQFVSNVGFVDLQEIKDFTKTWDYCRKDGETMALVLNEELPLTSEFLEEERLKILRHARTVRRLKVDHRFIEDRGPLDDYLTLIDPLVTDVIDEVTKMNYAPFPNPTTKDGLDK